MKKIYLLVGLTLLITGCSNVPIADQNTIATLVSATQTAAPLTTEPPAILLPSDTPDIPPGISLEAVYSDSELGYAFNYPAAWKVAYQENQSRGGYIQFTRADFQPDPKAGGLPAEEILLQVAVYNWDPKGDIHAYLEHRYQAWESSSIGFSEEKRWT